MAEIKETSFRITGEEFPTVTVYLDSTDDICISQDDEEVTLTPEGVELLIEALTRISPKESTKEPSTRYIVEDTGNKVSHELDSFVEAVGYSNRYLGYNGPLPDSYKLGDKFMYNPEGDYLTITKVK